MDNSDANYYGSKKEEDNVDQLLRSLSPIPGETHDLSSMDHFSIITSQAVSGIIFNGLFVLYLFHSAITVSSKKRISNETDS